jgi:hypothetical protein
MAKRQIKIDISEEGEISIDNAGNPNEKQILDELAELAEIANGNKDGFKIEKHVHSHGGHNHSHDVQTTKHS